MRPGSIFCVCALNALQNSMMFSPRWPSAGPIGGLGLALPAGTCSLMNPITFFAMLVLLVGANERSSVLPGYIEKLCLLDLPEFQLDRRRPAEDRHRYPK